MGKIRMLVSLAVILVCTGFIIRIFFTEQREEVKRSASIINVDFYKSASTTTVTEKVPELSSATETAAPVETKIETETNVTSAETEVIIHTVEFPIDLNAATLEELSQLPGIGEAIAANIIAYREAIGGFQNRQQLLEVSGIGNARYAAIYDLLYIYNETEYITESVQTEPPVENSGEEQVIPIIDINLATAEDFAMLPGVDLELGERIVSLREEIGGYKNVLELLYVEGMTDELYLSIMEYLVCIND